jgi:hypothetical protein
MDIFGRMAGMKLIDRFKKWDLKWFLVFTAVTVAAFVVVTFFKQDLPKITEVLLIVELVFLVSVTWGLAAHAVLRSLFAVSVELSLIIFLAQAYCATPTAAHTANDALMTLVGVGLIYIGIKFFWTIYEEALGRAKSLREAYDHKWPWLILIPFALFTGLFAWQVIQVLIPIVQNMCVYQPL